MKRLLKIFSFVLAGWPTRILFALILMASAPGLAVIAMISIVGIPLALILMAVPAAAALYIAHELIYQMFTKRIRPGGTGRLVSVGVALLAALVIAQAVNLQHQLRANALVAEDHDDISRGKIKSLAIVGGENWRDRDTMRCKALCQRLLLNGSVESVVIADKGPLDADATATIASFRGGGGCSSRKISDYDPDREPDGNGAKRLTAAELTRLKIAGGTCLFEREGRLGAADAAILYEEFPDPRRQTSTNRLDPFSDTLKAARISFHRNVGDTYNEESRLTVVRWGDHPVVVLPAPEFGAELRSWLGLARWERAINTPAKSYEWKPGVLAFVRDRLGLKTALSNSLAPSRTAILDNVVSGKTDAAAVVDDYFTEVIRGGKISRENAERVLAIIEDTDTNIVSSAPGAIASAVRAHPGLAPRFADALFKRFFATPADAREPIYRSLSVKVIATAISVLPDESLLDRHDNLLRAIIDPDRGFYASPLVGKLALFEPTAEEDFFAVYDASIAIWRRDDRDERWRDNFREALAGLCGLASASAAQSLADRLTAAPETMRYQRSLAMKAMLAGGLPAANILRLYGVASDEASAERIGDDLKRAIDARRCD